VLKRWGGALADRVAPLIRTSRRRVVASALIVVAVAAAVYLSVAAGVLSRGKGDPGPGDPAQVALASGTRFTAVPPDPGVTPRLVAIPLPRFAGAAVVLGASGVDQGGRVWFGVSAAAASTGQEAVPNPAARLFEFRPESRAVVDRGDPVAALQRAGLYRPRERQRQIPSKIVPGPDGYLYFASSDEPGTSLAGVEHPPEWGSHLWRLKAPAGAWEHLMTVPEHLTAVACGGKTIFALGGPGHVLYAYDTGTGLIETVRVGSIPGHVSHHQVADHRGHVYVPRLRFTVETPSRLEITLVEFTPGLHEVGQTPLFHYLAQAEQSQHGITGVQPLADGSVAFVTAAGYLYRVSPRPAGPAEVAALGWLDPAGTTYVATLFTYDGQHQLLGMSERDGIKQWLVFDLSTKKSTVARLTRWAEVMDMADAEGPLAPPFLLGAGTTLGGCATRDNQGSFYLVGRRESDPAVFQVRPAENTDNPLPGDPTKPGARAGADLAPVDADSALREAFHRELRALLDARGDAAGPAIAELSARHRGELPARAAGTTGVHVGPEGTRLDLTRPVSVYRNAGVPEAVILDNLARLEAGRIGSKGGARNQSEALVRAARRLLSLPPLPALAPVQEPGLHDPAGNPR
jgi:hypothetical protein